ncbi:autophagy-related protein 18g [Stemphylium lycopersici]|nr:autophagy-related protein 18g [Stemphylium lycopersici]
MSSSPENAAEHTTTPVSNLTYLHKQQRKGSRLQDNSHARGRNTSRYELGRRNRAGEKVTRIYPREVTKSPSSANRLSSTSPPSNYNATTSPLLSAIGATRNATAQYTNEWAKSVPFFPNSGSPGNGGIAIAGSPPTFHNSPGAREGLYAQQAMSNSPPGTRPLSHPNQYTNFGGRMQNSPGRDRRASIYSQGGRPPSQQFVPNPPLPHQPQAHYYGLPNLDFLNNVPSDGAQAGDGGCFCGFDTLSMAGDEAARSAENVLLVGSQGGLDVFRVEKSKMDIVGRLEGLRGAVIGAKILPWSSRKDPLAGARPLIALILHGPVIKDSRSSSGSGSSSVVDDSASESPSRPASLHGNHGNGQISGYQTTVEVYSLKEKRRLAVLYRTPLTPLTSPVDSPMFQPPPPVGDFVIDAKGKFIVVASGASGEVFVFAPYIDGHLEYAERFRCIGKMWTSVQNRERAIHSNGSSAADGSHDEIPPEKYGLPVFSLSDRWLAVSPPASSSLYPVNGVALTSPYYERAPGLAHHSVPPQPSPNCAVDAPNEAGLIDRLTREGTQVAIKSARWATEKGMQAFKSYMNKGQQGNPVSYGQDPMQHYFPPTHGYNQAQPRQEAAVISIFDLQKLVDAEETRSKSALQPIATIPASLGCSFLSFAPSGLMLMSVSKKGDYQDVWDLKRMNFRRARKTAREQPAGPHVRQVARFTRMTVANVIDVVWSAPRVDKLGVITDKGTVHMFPMPASAFQWPPARRLRPAAQPAQPKEPTSPTGPTGAVNSAKQVISSAKPWFDAVRTRTNSGGSRFSLSGLGVTPAAGAKSGKAVAAGVGKSINNIRHAGDNKMTLPSSPNGIKPYSVRWMSGRGRGSIALVSGGVLQIWRVQMRPATGKGKSSNTATITKKKLVEFGLAPIPDVALPPSVMEQLFPQPGDPEPILECYGDWFPRNLPSRKPLAPTLAPLSFSEIETNPPYQPFYTDKRVTRFVYARQALEVQGSASEYQPSLPGLVSDLHHDDPSPWLFGESIEATKLSSPITPAYDSGEDDVTGVAARIENKLVLRDGEEEVEQVVVTTRRRRMRKDGDEEGFFEDDCEVLDFAEDRALAALHFFISIHDRVTRLHGVFQLN